MQLCTRPQTARADRIGFLESGKQADLLVLDSSKIQHLRYLFARNPIRHIVKRGRLIGGTACRAWDTMGQGASDDQGND